MRVTHILPSVGTGGAEAVAATLHELGVARGIDSVLHPRLAHEGRAPWSAWLRWALGVRPEGRVIHAHLPWPDRLGAALVAARGRPLVVTLHLLPRGAWPRDRLLGLDARRVLRLASQRPATRWIALSRNDVAVLADLGVRAEIVRNAPPAPTPSSDPVVFPEGSLRLASVGRLDPQKGFDQMLDALASLREIPWHWAIAGDGPERDSLAARRDRLGLSDRVTLLGRRPARDVFARAELLLAPSRSEGMPLVPLEAMEAGVPVLASPIAPHSELLGEARGSLLDVAHARWPDDLARMFRDADARDALRLAQRALLGDDPRARLWRDYAALYARVAEER